MQSLNSGGVMMSTVKGCISSRGGNFVYQRIVGEWGLEILTFLTTQCLQSRYGDLALNQKVLCKGVEK